MPVPEVRFGAQLWSQASDWPGFLDAALAAEVAGWDAIWTWDHLHAIFGPWEQPILEGWQAITAVAAPTARARVGLMVGATPDAGKVPTLLGPPKAVAAAIRPYVELGFATIIVRLPAPYDPETIARIGEVRAALTDAPSGGPAAGDPPAS